MGRHERARIGLFITGGTYAYQEDIIHGAHEECVRRGYDLICSSGGRLDCNDPRSHAFELASPETLDAAILVPGTWAAPLDSPGAQALLNRYAGIRACLIGASFRDIPSVRVDNSTGVLELTRHLIEVHGRRRIAFIAGRGPEALERQQGFERGLRAAGLEPDPELLFPGDFTFEAGRAAAERWSENGRLACDAIVAANDWMAGGALELLQERGIRVPDDVSLTGFDDIDRASFMSPPLTTIRQLPRFLGAEAVVMIDGLLTDSVRERHVALPTFTQIRRSCGCFGNASALRSVAPLDLAPAGTSFSEARPLLCATLGRSAAHLARGLPESWAEDLVDALTSDVVRCSEQRFLPLFRSLLVGSSESGNVTAWHHVISQLRDSCVSLLAGDVTTLVRAETLFGRAYIVIGEQAELALGRRLLDREEVVFKLEDVTSDARTALDWDAVRGVLCDHLPRFKIPRCFLALGEAGAEESRLLFAFESGQALDVPAGGIPFKTSEIIAPEVQPAARTTFIVHSMFVQDEILGFSCFEMGLPDGTVFKALNDLASSAIKSTQMSRALIEEVTRRERAERARMLQELDIAAGIQKAILPKRPRVSGLELATLMLPATEVGGDYFDVLPCPDGCWIGIGDVAGHGLTAGLVMLMIQSIVAATVQDRPGLRAGEAWRVLNSVLSDNIRERMGQEEHATLSLLRYERSGRLSFAGAHEDLLVYKAAQRRCERIPTPGIWVGIGTDIPEEATAEREYRLEPGDVLLLYTDGILEAKDASGETYGTERLVRLLERHGHLPVEHICERVIADVRAWMSIQEDDMTLLVARHGESPR